MRADAAVIGAGPAGLAAAVSLRENGVDDVVILEREPYAGGVLVQCIHNGFGLHRFKEELTGPEYALRDEKRVRESGIPMLLSSAVLKIIPGEKHHTLLVLSADRGLIRLEAKIVVLAMGCRERTRSQANIPGSRPAGIMTAGLAQRLVNLEGLLPGRKVAIAGSGDIGLIMARRLVWEGAAVPGVVEIQPFAGGLIRNVVQCLHDFDIPLLLSHTITRIRGARRIEAITVCPLDEAKRPVAGGAFDMDCDTLLLSVGLIPENELSVEAGVELHPTTGGPVVNGSYMSGVPGIFACGNVLHVHDLADFVSIEAAECGKAAARYLREGPRREVELPVRAGRMVRYVVPSSVGRASRALLSFRPLLPAKKARLSVCGRQGVLLSRRLRAVHPATMIQIALPELPESAETEALTVHLDPEDA